MKKLVITQKELDKAFPNELLELLKPEDLFTVEQFKLKAMSIGVNTKDINDISSLMEIYEKHP